ncbi:MAG: class I SAM-dependent methyltransferase [Thermodesulfobacteriota bacterium]
MGWRDWLALERTGGGPSPDTPETTLKHGGIIRRKRLLARFYAENYRFFQEAAGNAPPGPRLEIGSGAGFIKEIIPEAVTSDYMFLPTLDLNCSALALPFRDRSLGAVFLMDVFHHLPEVELFFREAVRCLRPGGVLALVEPALTPWGRLVYRHLHHEPCDPGSPDWRFPQGGPLSAANSALPWMVFVRDRDRFNKLFPELTLQSLEYRYPVLYLLSGGLAYRQMCPDFAAIALEKLLHPFDRRLGLFMRVVLRRA